MTDLDGASTPAPNDTDTGGLPVVWSSPEGAWHVVHGNDAGGFYCEHCLYAVRRHVAEVGSVLVVDGEPLVGFLHVPKDALTDEPPTPLSAAAALARHRATIDIVVAVLRGWAQLARPIPGEPLRVLLTGYGPWGTVQNNPTGDAVSQPAVLDAIARRVGVEVALHTAVLAVDDTAIDGGPASVQAAIDRVAPHVVLSMGVHSRSPVYVAEHVASDRNLVVVDGVLRRAPDRPAAHTLPSHRILARGLLAGQQAQRS